MNQVSVTVDYRSHVLDETWEKLDNVHCPKCGHKSVWQEEGEDYYVGSSHLCTSCGCQFYLPCGLTDGTLNDPDKQRIEQIKLATP